MIKKNIVWFEEVGKEDVGLVGGKGANLGEMTKAEFPIPYGFVVTSHAYFDFIKANKLDQKIKNVLKLINFESPVELHHASTTIKSFFHSHDIPADLAREIIKRYEHLTLKEEQYMGKKKNVLRHIAHKIKSIYKHPLVAVRSSATAEDLPDASFAGQQETYLNIQGEHHLLEKVKECWASLFTERAIYYRHEKGYDDFKVGLAAVVQRMVESDKSGIAFSIDPVTNDKSKLIIEAIYGLGEYIVGGKVTPDHYEVDKRSFIFLKKEPAYQNAKYIKYGAKNVEIKLSHKEGSSLKLSDEEILRVAMLVKEIEAHYYFPQDIEWAIEKDKVFIVQSRPITTMKNIESGIKNQGEESMIHNSETMIPILTGAPASPGIGVGPVTVIQSPAEIDKIKKGDILVAPATNPDYVPAMKKAAAIVTERGGRTSHAAIVSRELGIPAIVGAIGALRILKNGMIVSVDGKNGEVFRGSILSSSKFNLHNSKLKKKKIKRLETKTKVYVNLAEPDQAEKIAKMNVDGVGLLRAEFMVAAIGTHPKEYIKHKREHIFVDRLVHDLHTFVKAFNPRPIIYRATDFKTNEYRNLKGGAAFEPKEENPMLGFRGASRYIADPEVFGLELQAIKRIWSMGFKNLHLMIPFIRVPWELVRIKEIIGEYGLLDMEEFKLLIMVEVPSCALYLEKFIEVGIDGVSIGTNDLTMMLLGVDRDNETISAVYDERNPVVLSTLKSIVKTCSEHGITSSICGQAASDYPQIVEMLIKEGITSISINPDTVDDTRERIHHFEKTLR